MNIRHFQMVKFTMNSGITYTSRTGIFTILEEVNQMSMVNGPCSLANCEINRGYDLGELP